MTFRGSLTASQKGMNRERVLSFGPTRNPTSRMKWYEASIDVEQNGRLLCDLIVVRGKTEADAKRLRDEIMEKLG